MDIVIPAPVDTNVSLRAIYLWYEAERALVCLSPSDLNGKPYILQVHILATFNGKK